MQRRSFDMLKKLETDESENLLIILLDPRFVIAAVSEL